MADGEDIQPLVCDNGTGMVKVLEQITYHLNAIRISYCNSLFVYGMFTNII